MANSDVTEWRAPDRTTNPTASYSEREDFRRILSVATLLLVAVFALLILLSLFATDRPTHQVVTHDNNLAPNVITPAAEEAKPIIAGLEQGVDSLMAERTQPAAIATRPTAASRARTLCVRVYRGGQGTRLECEP